MFIQDPRQSKPEQFPHLNDRYADVAKGQHSRINGWVCCSRPLPWFLPSAIHIRGLGAQVF